MYLHLPKYPRFFTAAAGSAFVTTGLVLLMVQLVAVNDGDFVDAAEPIVIDHWIVRDEREVVKKEPEVEKPPKVDPEPTPPPIMSITSETGAIDIAFVAPTASKSISIGPTALIDGEHIPIVKVQPNYPSSASSRGIEGYVVVSFTILPSGATAHAEVIEAVPANVFNRSALKAVERFKYKPKVVDGKAEPVHNVHHRLTYELANG